MASLSELEVVGAQVAGDSIDPNPGTIGGQNDYVFTRTFKVNSNVVKNYLFPILNPPMRIVDSKIQNAYLVNQRAVKVDDINDHLICVFAQIPSAWNESKYQPVTFPGVEVSSLFTPFDFPFRSSPYTKPTQARYYYQYFLGPISGIPTYPTFQPVDRQGNRVSVITDWTDPSADEYIALCASRGEIVTESVVLPWRGDIWALRTLFAVAK